MFAFFKTDTLENFWANQVGDIFFDLTVRGMKWEQSQIDLMFYPGLDNVPQYYEFDTDKKLIIKSRIVTHEEITEEVDGVQKTTVIEHESFVVKNTIEPIVYAAKGVIVKPC